MATKQNSRGISLLDALATLLIVILIGWALVKVFEFAASFMGKSRKNDVLISLSSRVNDALLDSKNYKGFSVQLSATPAVLPANLPLQSQISSTQQMLVGELKAAGPSTSYFDSKLNPCDPNTNSTDCEFFVEVQWNASASSAPPNQVLQIDAKIGNKPKGKTEKVVDTISFEIPKAFYTTTKELKCPANTPTKTYLGIRSYDALAQTVDCWYVDTAKQCPSGMYPKGLVPNSSLDASDPRKDPNPASSEVHLDCMPLYGIKCPDGYAPQKIYPIDVASPQMLTDACVSIFKDSLSQPRFAHILQQIQESQEGHPANTNGYYGLKWLNGRPCPPKYKLKAKGTYTANVVSDFRNIFVIHNSETKSPCGTQAICGDNNGSLWCDGCPLSDSARKQGCNLRNFPTPTDVGPNAGCNDPKIYDVNNSALNHIKNNYSCELEVTEKFKNGESITLGAQQQ